MQIACGKKYKFEVCKYSCGTKISNLRYADDTVLIADSVEKLQKILTTVARESENKGLQLNTKKTECMVISKQKDKPLCNIHYIQRRTNQTSRNLQIPWFHNNSRCQVRCRNKKKNRYVQRHLQ